MCGRFAFATKREKLEKQFSVENLVAEPPPEYNITPSQPVPIIRDNNAYGRYLSIAQWGLVPFWAKDQSFGARTFNARSETVREKPSFKHCIRRKRCIIPASGFYEWHTLGEFKQPHYISMKNGSLLALAGLWDLWEKENHILETCTILTTEANSFMKPIHDRMPVILEPANYATWLDSRNEHPDALLKQLPSQQLQSWPVSNLVGNPRNNSPELTQPNSVN